MDKIYLFVVNRISADITTFTPIVMKTARLIKWNALVLDY